jgi:hypothetical protein
MNNDSEWASDNWMVEWNLLKDDYVTLPSTSLIFLNEKSKEHRTKRYEQKISNSEFKNKCANKK